MRHCRLLGELANAVPIDAIEMSTFGGPADLFEAGGRHYSMQFLSYYPRYCFAHEHPDAYQAHRRLADSGGYFQAVWKKS
ncbi:MAG: hypothetical protein ACR2GQ_01850 [Gemmatimonadota bacterium]